jgi:hypothetical protein
MSGFEEKHDFSTAFFRNVDVRVERLGSQHYWIGIQKPGNDGYHGSINFWIETDLQIRSRYTKLDVEDGGGAYGVLP